MLYLLRKQIIILIGVFFAFHADAQRELNRPNHDNWPYYFGMTLAYNSSYLNTTKDSQFYRYDSVMRVEPERTGGIALGLLATLRLSNGSQ